MDKQFERGSYIQGQFQKITDPNGEIASRDPGDLDRPAVNFPFSFEHVHEAVAASKRSFASWKRLSRAARYSAVTKYRDLLKTRKDAVASTITREIGKPLWEARDEVDAALSAIDFFLHLDLDSESTLKIADAGTNSAGVIRFLPRGVMTILTPANLPVYLSHTQFIPSLLMGNTVVLKSSKNAPLTGQALAEIVHDSGLPAGVFNVIHGDSEVARRLVSHADVDGIFFTGSYETGTKIKKQILSDYGKVLVLQMVGKNGVVVWDDSNYEMALAESLLSAFLTTGQRYTSASQLLVHHKIFDRFLTDFHALAKKCRVGYGMGEGEQSPFMGPLVSEAAMENYLRYQGMAVREGCEEVMRGKTLERERKGYYVSPSIHIVGHWDPKSIYQKNEMYGPNVALYRVKELEEVTEILNQTQYGLVSSIYTASRENYLQVAEDVRVGQLHWNRPTTAWAHTLASQGIKKSGNARPMGIFSSQQCTYPMSSLERTAVFDAKELPAAFPRLENA
jgi:succinylglutamic semialdehyde dehydrogenase